MGRPRKCDRQSSTEIRDRILRVAETLFAKQGYSSTTTREIAASAKINKALINYYFQSKENLYKTVFSQNAEVLFNTIFAGLNPDLQPDSAIDVIIDSYYNLFMEHPETFPPLLARELADGAPYIRSIVSDKSEYLEKLLPPSFKVKHISSEMLLSLMFTIGIIFYSILAMPIQSILRDKLGLSPVTMEDIRLQIKQFVKQGISI